MFLGWMEASNNILKLNLTYAKFPRKFVYNNKNQKWQPRKERYSTGRLHYFLTRIRELYYMRILLIVQYGCTNYDSIRTMNGITYLGF